MCLYYIFFLGNSILFSLFVCLCFSNKIIISIFVQDLGEFFFSPLDKVDCVYVDILLSMSR